FRPAPALGILDTNTLFFLNFPIPPRFLLRSNKTLQKNKGYYLRFFWKKEKDIKDRYLNPKKIFAATQVTGRVKSPPFYIFKINIK
ncbi:hypothetical protein, partial [Salmonella enterica]|uniref:hypothetical protein n=1 Tax=Salmonella enterica TaxID=28901 RepID=UPI0038BC0752